MKSFKILVLILLISNLLFSSNYKTLILGRWLNTGLDGKRTIMVFSPGGDMGIVLQYKNNRTVSLNRKYYISGSKIYVSPKNSINAYVLTVIKITNNELIIKNETGQVYHYIKHHRRHVR
jgi:hypothetical protein